MPATRGWILRFDRPLSIVIFGMIFLLIPIVHTGARTLGTEGKSTQGARVQAFGDEKSCKFKEIEEFSSVSRGGWCLGNCGE
jgi:hypothetical protein